MKKYLFYLPLLLSFYFVSCSDSDDTNDNLAKNGFATGVCTDADYFTATISGFVDLKIIPGVKAYGVVYGTTNTLTSETGTLAPAKELDENNGFSVALDDLNPATTYYFATFVQLAGEYKYGAVKSFATKGLTKGDYVDLGLKSGTLWASKNVGAKSPTDGGLYFQWGDTKGYTSNTSDGKSFDWPSYKHCNGSYTSITRYNTSPSLGIVDDKTELVLSEDDAAYANCGKDWRMPSKEQFDELVSNAYTLRKTVTVNNISGKIFISRKNGNSIFFPLAGYRNGPGLYSSGVNGSYWSRTLRSNNPLSALRLNCSTDAVIVNDFDRNNGLCVRPVRNK